MPPADTPEDDVAAIGRPVEVNHLLDAEELPLRTFLGVHIGRGQEDPPLLLVDVGQDRGGGVPGEHGIGGVDNALELVVIPGETPLSIPVGHPYPDLSALVRRPSGPSAIGRGGKPVVPVLSSGAVWDVAELLGALGGWLGLQLARGVRLGGGGEGGRGDIPEQPLGLGGREDAFQVEADAPESSIQGPAGLESAEHIHDGLPSEGFQNEVPDRFSCNPGLFMVEDLDRPDAIPTQEVLQPGNVLGGHRACQGTDHPVFHPRGQFVELGILDDVLPVLTIEELTQEHPVESRVQLASEGGAVPIEPCEDLAAMDDGGAPDVARIRTIDADVALAKVSVLVVDQDLDLVSQPHLEIRLAGGQLGQEAEEGVFRQLPASLIKLDLKRVAAEVLPVESPVLDALLAEGHVQSIVKLTADRPHHEQGAHQPEAALPDSRGRHHRQSTNPGCRLFPVRELAGHDLDGVQRFF